MTTFYLREANGQTFFTPPMSKLESGRDGDVYESEGSPDHANLWVAKDGERARYIEDGVFFGSRMRVLKTQECVT